MSSQSEASTTRDSSDITRQKKARLIYNEKDVGRQTLPYYLPQSFDYIYSLSSEFCNCLAGTPPNTPIINYPASSQTPARGTGATKLTSITIAWFAVNRALNYRVFLVECPSLIGACPMTGSQIISTADSGVLPSSTLSYTYTPTGNYVRIYAFVIAYTATKQSLPGIYSPEFSV